VKNKNQETVVKKLGRKNDFNIAIERLVVDFMATQEVKDTIFEFCYDIKLDNIRYGILQDILDLLLNKIECYVFDECTEKYAKKLYDNFSENKLDKNAFSAKKGICSKCECEDGKPRAKAKAKKVVKIVKSGGVK